MSGVFYIKHDEKMDYFYPVQSIDKFKIPEVVYGNINSIAIRVWNTFAVTKKSTGILLTGNKGSGKTILGEIICNLAIDRGLPVYMITEIEMTLNLIAYIRNLSNCVIFLDEFGKNVNHQMMDQMLTMFSDVNSSCKLFILTENTMDRISYFIKDRPGRIRYHLDYEKLGKDIYDDYLDKNPVDPEFKKDLDDVYAKAKEFSFDVLEAIVSEHKRFPKDSLEDLLNLLNCKSLLREKRLEVDACFFKGEELSSEQYTFTVHESLSYIRKYNAERAITLFIHQTKDNSEDNQPAQLGGYSHRRFDGKRVDISWKDVEMNMQGQYVYVNKEYEIELLMRMV